MHVAVAYTQPLCQAMLVLVLLRAARETHTDVLVEKYFISSFVCVPKKNNTKANSLRMVRRLRRRPKSKQRALSC